MRKSNSLSSVVQGYNELILLLSKSCVLKEKMSVFCLWIFISLHQTCMYVVCYFFCDIII